MPRAQPLLLAPTLLAACKLQLGTEPGDAPPEVTVEERSCTVTLDPAAAEIEDDFEFEVGVTVTMEGGIPDGATVSLATDHPDDDANEVNVDATGSTDGGVHTRRLAILCTEADDLAFEVEATIDLPDGETATCAARGTYTCSEEVAEQYETFASSPDATGDVVAPATGSPVVGYAAVDVVETSVERTDAEGADVLNLRIVVTTEGGFPVDLSTFVWANCNFVFPAIDGQGGTGDPPDLQGARHAIQCDLDDDGSFDATHYAWDPTKGWSTTPTSFDLCSAESGNLVLEATGYQLRFLFRRPLEGLADDLRVAAVCSARLGTQIGQDEGAEVGLEGVWSALR